MHKFHKRTWAEIHLDRLENNLSKITALLGENTLPCAVVKADAYGHGDSATVTFLEKIGVRWFAVSNITEAVRLRKLGIKGEIIVLGYGFSEDAEETADLNLIQTVTGFDHALSLAEKTSDSTVLRVHVKIDTGMGRLGISAENITACVDEIMKIIAIKKLSIEAIYTHLAVADSNDESDVDYTEKQIDAITSVISELEKRGISNMQFHFQNSAGTVYYDGKKSSIARLGIMLYGLYPNHALPLPCELEPVMEFKTTVTQVKTIKSESYVSYGRTFKSKKETQIASMAVGYADGYSRALSSKAEVIINGKLTKVVGRICMDQTMIDVTGIDVKVGDTVTLFGSCGAERITADDLADIYGTIGYEIICGISKRVPRVIYYKGEIIDVIDYCLSE